ncbi:hypothetical protein ACH6EH_07415 [Paenibacillus sp. JSM ZJ436]|uniref:hypothetical protein n=1 Tax=Paenibacillus sp. JSM ZJ436 TaxID=3376190 RepID=UPI0037ADA715
MRWGYVVKGRLYGEPYESQLFEDIEDREEHYDVLKQDDDYGDIKKYTVYLHYEEDIE